MYNQHTTNSQGIVSNSFGYCQTYCAVAAVVVVFVVVVAGGGGDDSAVVAGIVVVDDGGNILAADVGSFAGSKNQFAAASTSVAGQTPVEERLRNCQQQHRTKRSSDAVKDVFARSEAVPIAFAVALFASAAVEMKTQRP